MPLTLSLMYWCTVAHITNCQRIRSGTSLLCPAFDGFTLKDKQSRPLPSTLYVQLHNVRYLKQLKYFKSVLDCFREILWPFLSTHKFVKAKTRLLKKDYRSGLKVYRSGLTVFSWSGEHKWKVVIFREKSVRVYLTFSNLWKLFFFTCLLTLQTSNFASKTLHSRQTDWGNVLWTNQLRNNRIFDVVPKTNISFVWNSHMLMQFVQVHNLDSR